MGQADDVERVEAGCRTQPQSLCKRCVAEQGGDAGGGSTLGTQSTFAQMGHIDSPGRSRLNRDIHFEKSPKRFSIPGIPMNTTPIPPWSKIARTCSKAVIFKRSASSMITKVVGSAIWARA